MSVGINRYTRKNVDLCPSMNVSNILVAKNNGDVKKNHPQLKLEQRLLPVPESYYCEREMPRLINVLRRSYKAVRDTELAQILKSEIKHEQTSVAFQTKKVGSLGDFTLDWDDPRFQDVVLRRKYGVGEEIAVSALLGSPVYEGEGLFSREALMKVCITKPGLSSVLQFDCGVTGNGDGGGSEFSIHNAYYLQSQSCLGASVYKGPLFSTLDPELQDELKEYLTTRGIVEDFTDFLLLHLHRRENSQYLNWLQKLEATISGDK